MFTIGDRVRVKCIADMSGWYSNDNPQRFIGMCGTVKEISSINKFPYTLHMDNGERNIRFTADELAPEEEVAPCEC